MKIYVIYVRILREEEFVTYKYENGEYVRDENGERVVEFDNRVTVGNDLIGLLSILLGFFCTNYSVVAFFLDKHLEKEATLKDSAKLLAIEMATIIAQPVMLIIAMLLFFIFRWEGGLNALIVYAIYLIMMINY